jgi:hypothetical protein
MKKVAKSFMLFAFAVLLVTGCIFPFREGSQSQKLDQDVGVLTGIPIGLTQAAQEAQVGTATSEGAWYNKLPPSVGDIAEQAIGTLSPVINQSQPPEELEGPPLFFVTTKGSGGWTNNLMFPAPGDRAQIQQTDPGYFFGLGDAGSSGWTAEVTHGVEIGVYDTANLSDFYLVQPTVWMEFANLVGRAGGGPGSADTTLGIPHIDSQHADPDNPQTHPHGFSEAKADREHLTMVIADGIAVIIVEVDEQARMALVKLPPLWIASSETQPTE